MRRIDFISAIEYGFVALIGLMVLLSMACTVGCLAPVTIILYADQVGPASEATEGSQDAQGRISEAFKEK